MNNLEKYGASERYIMEATMYQDSFLGRVVTQYKDYYLVATNKGEFLAEVSGKFIHDAYLKEDYPAVGDFIMVDREEDSTGNLIINKVLKRKSVFQRKAAGKNQENQIIAANIDLIFICISLNANFSLSRIERYLSAAWESGAKPVIVLTKADLCEDVDSYIKQVESIALDTPIVSTTVTEQKSLEPIRNMINSQTTVSLVGSSGVGKSTLINSLLGKDVIKTNDIRDDDKGKHTTTRRELFVLPTGGVFIDTPGMREFGVDTVDLEKTFTDIDDLIGMCKFNDCTHTNEPGCAVLKAIKDGTLDERRFQNYLKLQKEARYEGLSSKEVEKVKLDTMFASYGGMKKARKAIKKKRP
ncbi:MAG: ribosome small subunit-dependent GTPase A [Eubacteriaceae bacterium]